MILVDANIILRYVLNDNEEYSNQSAIILESEQVTIKIEILAEVIYVLQKLYAAPRSEIVSTIKNLLNYRNIEIIDGDVVSYALEIYEVKNIDFINTILISYNKVKNYKIYSFDKDVIKNISYSKSED